jgi:multimeric flavodoxin WrbA
MTNLTILYHSGYGHTRKQAEAVREGAAMVDGVEAALLPIDADGQLPADGWQALAASDGIIFGSPTYMGGPSWQFKRIADQTSKVWAGQGWKDKVAAGFTNSASISGDKLSTLNYMFTLAMQHGMLWVGSGLMPSNKKSADRNDVNWLGAYSGAMAQSPADSSPEEGPLPGDLETARRFGQRVAEATRRWSAKAVTSERIRRIA